MTGRDIRDRRCSLARAAGSVGEFWTLLVLRDLWSFGPRRFDELQAGLSVSTSTLANRLGRLVEHGVVARRPYQQSPERFEYCLTDAGTDLVPALLVLTAWGDKYLADPAGPPAVVRHGAQHRARPVVVCGECGEPLTLANTHLEHAR